MTRRRRQWAGVALACTMAALCACSDQLPAPLRDAQRLEQQAQRPPGDSENSLEALLRAHRLYQATDRGDERGQAEVAIAALYLRRGELDQAQTWAGLAAAAADVTAATRALAFARLTQISLRRGAVEQAAASMAQAERCCPECSREATFLVLAGRVQLAGNHPAEALSTARQALQEGRFGDEPDRVRADAQRLAGEALLAQADYAPARDALESAFQSDHAAARAERIWLDLDLLSHAYRGLGQDAEAVDYARRSALARSAAQADAP